MGLVTSNKYYYLKDYLGSIRVVVDTMCEIVSYDDYDPWGMILNGRSSNYGFADDKYKFKGKERDIETGYDYFSPGRTYDSKLVRWLQVDPLADKYPGWSPYNYALNNPIKFIDPNGMDVDEFGMERQSLEGEGERVASRSRNFSSYIAKDRLFSSGDKKNLYIKQTEKFYFSKFTYHPPDGEGKHWIELVKGFSYTYFVTGYWATYKNMYGDWYVILTALGRTDAETYGKVTFNGNVSLLQDGVTLDKKSLTINGASLYDKEKWKEIGDASFKLPESGKIALKLFVDYNLFIPGMGISSPLGKIKELINIYP